MKPSSQKPIRDDEDSADNKSNESGRQPSKRVRKQPRKYENFHSDEVVLPKTEETTENVKTAASPDVEVKEEIEETSSAANEPAEKRKRGRPPNRTRDEDRIFCCEVCGKTFRQPGVFPVLANAWDPYAVLGVSRRSSSQDIRKAYKKLAKEWHPDKNKSPEAESKFVEVNKAYELLSDPERKKYYDQKGIFEDTPNFRKTNQYPEDDHNDPFSEFASFFGSGNKGFKFQFQMPEMGFYHKQNINMRLFEKNILPTSNRQLHIILVYSDWCLTCIHALPLWQRLVEEMEPIGIVLGTVRYDREIALAEKLGARKDQLPHVVLVADSKITYYKEDQFSVIKMIEFVRNRFPSKLLTHITDSSVDSFLNGWRDNMVRVLLFGKLDMPRLRYLTLAFSYRSRAVFGYVQLNQDSTKALCSKFNIPSNLDSLLLFHEDNSKPVARLSMSDLPFSTMKDIIESNKYLQLPRLSSQAMLDALCPAESSRARRRLCVVLVTEDRPEDDPPREALREFARQFKVSRERLVFTYIFRDKQQDFVNALVKGAESPAEPQLHVAIVWRQEETKVSYRWLAEPFVDKSDQWNSSKQILQTTLQQLLAASQPLPYEASLKEMVDEHAQGLLARVVTRLAAAADILRDHVTRQDVLAVGSVLGTILFIAAVGYVMAYLVRLEEESIKKNQSQRGSKVPDRPATMELKLHEMRAETYNGMVRLLKPGCRSVILLVDNDSKTALIPKFHKAVWPYRKNKSLTFGWMNMERGLQWYTQLLALTLKLIDEEDQNSEPGLDVSRIKPRNCVGTVLALNGYRKYVCIYHARHPEGSSTKGGERMQRMARRLAISQSQSLNDGAFMGFESEESSSDSDIERGDPSMEKPLINEGPLRDLPLPMESLLDGLPNWLDRLFEGTAHRYYVNYWPDFGNY
nr:EOG090X049L [Eulimnadia texana]